MKELKTKLMKMIMVIALLMQPIVGNLSVINAASANGDRDISPSVGTASIKAYFSVGGWTTRNYTGGFTKYRVKGDDGVTRDAFCVQPEAHAGNPSYTESLNTVSEAKRSYLSKIVFYAYDVTNKTDVDYLKCQILLWDIVMNELSFPAYSEYYDENTTYSKGEISATINGSDFSLDSSAYKNYKSGILAKVNGSVDFDQTSITLKEGESETVTDRNGLLTDMVLRENTANVKAVQNGNSVTITASSASRDGKLVFKRTTADYDNNDGATMFYYANSNQNKMTFKMSDNYSAEISVTVIKNGKLKIQKVSSCDKELTEIAGAEYYSLKGAEFKLYTDSACTKQAKDSSGTLIVFTTNNNGLSNEVSLEAGTYYVKETKTPKGYVKEPAAKEVTVKPGESNSFTFGDKPVFDPINAILTKTGNDNVKLGGAQFTIKYYNNNYEQISDIHGSPLRTWVFETDDDGYFAYRPKWKVSGAELFGDEDGIYVFIPGTYIIEETLVPEGYVKAEPFMIHVSVDENGNPVEVFSTATGGTITNDPTEGYQLQEIHEGYGYLVKESSDPSFSLPLSGAEFTVYTDSKCSKIAKINGSDENAVLRTKEDGTSDKVALVPGTYYVKETKAPKGYRVSTEVYKIVVNENETTTLHVSDAPEQGSITLVKKPVSEEYAKTHSLSGAVYTVYKTRNGEELLDPLGTLTTKEDGTTNKLTVNIGTYYVKETTVPHGWEVDKKIYEVTVTASETVTVTSKEGASNGYLNVKKSILSESGEYLAKYPVKGTVFTLYTDAEGVTIAKDVFGNDAILTIKEDGTSNTIELLKGTYYIKETVVPFGYELNDSITKVTIRGAETYTFESSNKETIGRMSIHKSVENEEYLTLYSIAGTEYTLFMTEDCTAVAKDVDGKDAVFVIGEDGFSNVIELYVGKYFLKETSVSKGYKIDLSVQDVDVKEVEEVVVETRNAPLFAGMTVLKHVEEDPGATQVYNLSGIEFTAYTDEECTNIAKDVNGNEAIFVMDEEGKTGTVIMEEGTYYVKETKNNLHFVTNETIETVTLTGGEMEALELEFTNIPTSVTVEKLTYDTTGVFVPLEGIKLALYDESDLLIEEWTSDGAPHFFRGLEIGKAYKIVEIEGKEGFLPIDGPIFFVVENSVDEQNVRVVNEPVPSIKTTATFIDETKIALAEKQDVIDQVRAEGLRSGTDYKLVGALMDGETVIAEGSKEFKALSDGVETIVEVEFHDVELSGFIGKKVVVFEELYKKSGEEWVKVGEHKDLMDEDQTLYIPKIHTTAYDKTDEDKLLVNEPSQVIVDRVYYEKLIPGKKYTLCTVLMDKETGKEILDEKGEKIQVETEFIPEESDGYVEAEIEVDGKYLEGKSVVVFEDAYYEDKLIALHHDIDDEEQTVYVPSIKTTASIVEIDKMNPEDITILIRDVVEYKNLVPGETYTAEGILMNPNGSTRVDSKGEPIVSRTGFVAKDTNGTVEVFFTLHSPFSGEKKIVVYEWIYEGERLIASHKDISDEKQTVTLPSPELYIAKVDDRGEPVEGARLQLLDMTGKVVYEWVTMGDAADVSEYVVFGAKYILRETETPFGSETAKDIEFIAEGYDKEPLTVTMTDARKTYFISVIKRDAEDHSKVLEGAEFTVYDRNNKVALDVNGKECRGVTDKTGSVAFELFYSEEPYYVKETNAPSGYRLDRNSYPVELKEDYDFAKENPIVIYVDDTKEPPSTGIRDNLPLYIAVSLFTILLAGCVIILKTRKR